MQRLLQPRRREREGVGFGELVVGVKYGAANEVRYHGAPAMALATDCSGVQMLLQFVK